MLDVHFLESRDLRWNGPPPLPKGPDHNYPSLLFSWWCTICAVVIILTRIIGRKVRSNVLFREDWIMMAALIPLLIRMALIHVVLLYRTNNVQTVGYQFTPIEIEHRSMGSRLVLAARIFYAMFIWISKLTVSEFLKRITVRAWRRSYELTLQGIRIFLFISFGAVVIATLAGCQPFDHYWQVVPDPGPQCRNGYANLVTMGTCDILTDILLIAFPIPIVLRSGQTWKRKLQLGALFGLSIIMIGITMTRVPEVIAHRGRQQYRTVWASGEILASAAVSNAVILGSFVRDKGTKRNKYRTHSVTESERAASVRRPAALTVQQMSSSEEDLFRFVGMRIPDHLRDDVHATPRPAPAAPPARRSAARIRSDISSRRSIEKDLPTEGSGSDDSLHKSAQPESIISPSPSTDRRVNFFDVGGLLEEADYEKGPYPDPPRSRLSQSHSAESNTRPAPIAHDFASTPTFASSMRRTPRALLQDVGNLFTPSSTAATTDRSTGDNGSESLQPLRQFSHFRRQSDSHLHSSSQPASTNARSPMPEHRGLLHNLRNAGGLLLIDEVPGSHPRSPPSSRPLTLSIPLQPMASAPPQQQQPFTTARHPHTQEMLDWQNAAGSGGVARAAPSESGTSPTSQDSNDFTFQDVGGLLADDRDIDPTAASLRRAMNPRSSRP